MLRRIDEEYKEVLEERVDHVKLSQKKVGEEGIGESVEEEDLENLSSEKTEKISEELSKIIYLKAISFKDFESAKGLTINLIK